LGLKQLNLNCQEVHVSHGNLANLLLTLNKKGNVKKYSGSGVAQTFIFYIVRAALFEFELVMLAVLPQMAEMHKKCLSKICHLVIYSSQSI
jgi:hypothetical protein